LARLARVDEELHVFLVVEECGEVVVMLVDVSALSGDLDRDFSWLVLPFLCFSLKNK